MRAMPSGRQLSPERALFASWQPQSPIRRSDIDEAAEELHVSRAICTGYCPAIGETLAQPP